MHMINTIGINWDESSTPESDQVSSFQGTFAESEMKDVVTGTLVLCDGQQIDYYTECSLNMDQFQSMQEFFSIGEE